MTFRYSLIWATVPVVILIVAALRHRPYPVMIAWTAVILTVCLAPIGIWLADRAAAARQERRRARQSRVALTREPELTSANSQESLA